VEAVELRVKDNLRNSLDFIKDYENISIQYVKHTGYDGVEYLNTGDWVEFCTALGLNIYYLSHT